MSAEQATALIVAVTGLVAAVGAVYAQLRQTHALMNSRMTELLSRTEEASAKLGELRGRDFAASSQGSKQAPDNVANPDPSQEH